MSIDIEHFVSKIESFKNRKIAENWESQIEINDVRLQVRLPDIYEQGLIHVRYANQRAQDILRSWIYHLAFCEMKLQNQPSTSILIFKNAALQLNPVDHHQKYLAQLLNLFKRGLEKPLHFFPNTSLEYIQEGQIRGKSKTAALKAAQRKWLNSDFARGESDDPYYDICFRQYDPLDDSFQKISETVFKPVFAHYTELEI
jgi:exodeoxyribonuclease V gamma subunit